MGRRDSLPGAYGISVIAALLLQLHKPGILQQSCGNFLLLYVYYEFAFHDYLINAANAGVHNSAHRRLAEIDSLCENFFIIKNVQGLIHAQAPVVRSSYFFL